MENIPQDFQGAMGVPVTFLAKFNPDQFEILGADYEFAGKRGRFYVNGTRKFARVVIRKKSSVYCED